MNPTLWVVFIGLIHVFWNLTVIALVVADVPAALVVPVEVKEAVWLTAAPEELPFRLTQLFNPVMTHTGDPTALFAVRREARQRRTCG